MEWIKVKDKKPEWGQLIFVYRGKEDFSRWIYDITLFEVTNKFDSSITHWCPITLPIWEGRTAI